MLGLYIDEVESFRLPPLLALLGKRRVGTPSVPIYVESVRGLGLLLFLVSAHSRALINELGRVALSVGLLGGENPGLGLSLPPEVFAQLVVDLRVLCDFRRAQLNSLSASLASRFVRGINLLKLDTALALHAQLDSERVHLSRVSTRCVLGSYLPYLKGLSIFAARIAPRIRSPAAVPLHKLFPFLSQLERVLTLLFFALRT